MEGYKGRPTTNMAVEKIETSKRCVGSPLLLKEICKLANGMKISAFTHC